MGHDIEKGNFHIEARHAARNPRKHFIRRVIVGNNGAEIEKRSYLRQTIAALRIEDRSDPLTFFTQIP